MLKHGLCGTWSVGGPVGWSSRLEQEQEQEQQILLTLIANKLVRLGVLLLLLPTAPAD
jgi:hypothetical protein